MAIFNFVQGRVESVGGNTPLTEFSLAFPGPPPTPGNLFCIAVFTGIGDLAGPTVIHDNQANIYTLSTHSPILGHPPTGGNLFLAYLIAPSNPGALVIITWTNPTTLPAAFLGEFSFTTPAVYYDKDAFQESGSASTTITLPTITPSVAHSFLYAFASPAGSITAPAAGNPAGPWMGLGIDTGITFIGAEYCLNATGPTPVNFTVDTGGGSPLYSSMSMAFSPSPIPVTSGEEAILRGPHQGSRVTPPYNP